MKKVIVSGFGGQGVLSLGQFIAYSALEEGYSATWLPSYGPEMRGGTANCSVVFDEKEIASPLIKFPDVLIAMNEPSLIKFENNVVAGGLILVNKSMMDKRVERDDVEVLYVPVDELCKKANNPRAANILMLGVLISKMSVIEKSSAQKAIRLVFAEKPLLIEPNLKAFEIGFEYFSN